MEAIHSFSSAVGDFHTVNAPASILDGKVRSLVIWQDR
jgi:hypothetical protein